MLDNENVVIETTVTETEPIQEVVQPEVKPQPLDKNTILREMSKEYGVNLYSAEGLAAFKKFQDDNKSEQEKLQDQLNSLKEKENEYKTKEDSYQAQIAALQLGISEDKLNDALALAKINMTEGQTIKEGLMAVKAKYGDTFSDAKSRQTEVVIGTQLNPDEGDHPVVDEALARYLKKTKK